MLQGILFFLLPFLIHQLVNKFKLFNWLGPVIIAYGIGILLANLPIISLNAAISETLTELTVPLAIPLLLFANDIRQWLIHAKVAILSFSMAVISVVILSILVAPLFSDMPESWKLSGMMVGVYTGGTPNMASIGLALDVNKNSYLLLNTADLILGGIYLIGLMTFIKPILKHFLPAFTTPESHKTQDLAFIEKGTLKDSLISITLAVFIVLLSAGISFLLVSKISIPIIMLGLTSISIICSFMPQVKKIKGSYGIGNYFILVFCISIGSLIQIETLLEAGSKVFYFCALVMFGAILLHIILAKIFKIDVDTVIITSTAAIYGPAFIGPVATAIGNPAVVVTGLTTGILGYAVGNYLGILVAYLVKGMIGV